ncbi:MAG TPA: hypothetical protein VHS78_18555 [Candidatus Elarobacter sp.]|jgi:hypothetical protein|nr:hypothetical protein [Candidatus Elarobacter sp.]
MKSLPKGAQFKMNRNPSEGVGEVESAFQRFARGVGETVWAFAGPIIGNLCDYFDDLDRIARSADVLARRYRWGISTSWPPSLVATLGRLTDQQVRIALVDRAILDFYRADNWRELEALVDNIASYDAVDSVRVRHLRGAVQVIRASTILGSFNAATFVQPVLFIELEGLCRDFCEQDPDLNAEFADLGREPTWQYSCLGAYGDRRSVLNGMRSICWKMWFSEVIVSDCRVVAGAFRGTFSSTQGCARRVEWRTSYAFSSYSTC